MFNFFVDMSIVYKTKGQKYFKKGVPQATCNNWKLIYLGN